MQEEEKLTLSEVITLTLITAIIVLCLVIVFVVNAPVVDPEDTELYISAYRGTTAEIIEQINDEAYKAYLQSTEVEPETVDVEENDNDLGAQLVDYLIDVTQEDIDLLARVVMSEASVLNFEAKQMIAQTVVNRVRSSKFPNTIADVVYKKHQYSTQNNGKPNKDCYAAAIQALRYEDYPTDMYYFRMGHYHKWATDYKCVNGCYFSTE